MAGGGSAVVYESGGQEYVALTTNRAVWAFKLGGTVPPDVTVRTAAAPVARELFTGPIQDVSDIEVVSNVRDMGVTGSHYMTDEYAFSVYRARVKAGTSVRWTNNGPSLHSVVEAGGASLPSFCLNGRSFVGFSERQPPSPLSFSSGGAISSETMAFLPSFI